MANSNLTSSITLNNNNEVDRCLFTNFFLDYKEPNGWNPFYMKLLSILEENAFELPELNQVKWPGWPSKKMRKSDRNQLKTFYPNLQTGPLNEKNMKKMLTKFYDLASLMGYVNGNEDNIVGFMNKLKSDQDVYSKIKVLICCHITGKKLLKNRIALNSWKRFHKHFQQMMPISDGD